MHCAASQRFHVWRGAREHDDLAVAPVQAGYRSGQHHAGGCHCGLLLPCQVLLAGAAEALPHGKQRMCRCQAVSQLLRAAAKSLGTGACSCWREALQGFWKQRVGLREHRAGQRQQHGPCRGAACIALRPGRPPICASSRQPVRSRGPVNACQAHTRNTQPTHLAGRGFVHAAAAGQPRMTAPLRLY
jgi:hypothetical protein